MFFDEKFLELSWKWLNDPDIRLLTNTPDFSKKQQEEWYNLLPKLSDYLIWGVEADGIPVGVCGLKNITYEDCEYWGYLGEKDYWGLGIGREMMCLLENKAREMGKSSIRLRVIKDNVRAISLYIKQGYIIESSADSLHYMRKKL